ncbi:MAG: DUF1844 domain-containing protein [Thermoanaerobaculia bacterium]|nr:DUF1844 domain-containing protein [Thermoanaerobaculia bacterium]
MGIKVTDKRMFTADGELREEFRDTVAASATAEPAPASAPGSAPAAPPAGERAREPEPQPSAARLELPGAPPGAGPGFFDLVELLAEPIPLYLGDVELPGGQKVENLEMARLHIDLLDVLRQKTMGNLSSQELAFLEDLLYRARLRYVQKRG